MTKRINMNPGASARGGAGVGTMTSAGNPWIVSDALADELVLDRRLATYTDQTASASSSSLPVRTAALRLASIGPSHGELNPTTHDISKFVGAFGASAPGISPERAQVSDFYPVAYWVGNGGYSGDKTQDILDRSNANVSTTRKSIQDVMGTRPHAVCGASLDTNDFGLLTPANYGTMLPQIIGRHRTIVQSVTSYGALYLEDGNYPYSANTHTYPDLTRRAVLDTNAVYQADAAASGGRIEYVDAFSAVGDPLTGHWLPDCSQNDANAGLHSSFYGRYLIDRLRAAVLTRRFGPSAGLRYQGPNLLTAAENGSLGNNSLGIKTGSGVGGGLRPLGWTLGANGNLAQNLHSQRVVDGRRYFTMLGTSTAANASQTCYFPIDAAGFTALGLVAGDIIGLEYFMYVGDGNGGPPPTLKTTTARLDVSSTNGTMNWVARQNATALVGRSFPGPYVGHIVYQPYQLPAMGTVSAFNAWCEWITDDLMQWEFGVAYPNMVKIGSNGVIDAQHM